MPDEDGAHDVKAPLEAPHELEPVSHRVRAAALAVAEGRQVEREHPVACSRDERTDVVPDPGRLGGATEEDDRGAPFAPTAIGEGCPGDPDERAAVERARRLLAAVRRQVEDKGGERHNYDENQQREQEPPAPGAQPAPRRLLTRWNGRHDLVVGVGAHRAIAVNAADCRWPGTEPRGYPGSRSAFTRGYPTGNK